MNPLSPRLAERTRTLQTYPFAEHSKLKERLKEEGVDLIDLGRGDPDLAPPAHVVEALIEAASDHRNHRYPLYEGMRVFREAASEWCNERFCIQLDPDSEVITLIGAKEGVANTIRALVDEGSNSLITTPAYPVPRAQTMLAGGRVIPLPLDPENGFLPKLSKVPPGVLKGARAISLNYPNNPTGGVATLDFFGEVVSIARKYGIVVLNDAVYSEITFGGYRSPSLLQVPGAKSCSVEFHSLSKTFNMAGWRIGFAIGNREVLAALLKIKSITDTSVFIPIQIAAIAALQGPQGCVQESCCIYEERRDVLYSALSEAGLRVEKPRATFYLWARVPSGTTSAVFTRSLLEQAGVLVSDGSSFGEGGEGYIRVSLTTGTERIREADPGSGGFSDLNLNLDLRSCLPWWAWAWESWSRNTGDRRWQRRRASRRSPGGLSRPSAAPQSGRCRLRDGGHHR